MERLNKWSNDYWGVILAFIESTFGILLFYATFKHDELKHFLNADLINLPIISLLVLIIIEARYLFFKKGYKEFIILHFFAIYAITRGPIFINNK